ncbi:hypothetical protein ACSNOI_17805 [Actinomadura kijaniata]|uniref:hypothetical protein n=1 Tax=Actinomadura kijaniata TaxID=46161 RepID=UPI003F1C4969
MPNDRKDPDDRPLADRREDPEAAAGDEFGDEHTPGPTDPPNASDDAPGGEAEGYSPQTEVP